MALLREHLIVGAMQTQLFRQELMRLPVAGRLQSPALRHGRVGQQAQQELPGFMGQTRRQAVVVLRHCLSAAMFGPACCHSGASPARCTETA